MPLIYSKSKAAVGKNISKEEAAGKPHKQAVAIALETQRRAKKKPVHKTTLEGAKKERREGKSGGIGY